MKTPRCGRDRVGAEMLRRSCAQALRSFTSSSLTHYTTIQAVPREVRSSKAAAKERSQGRIPAVVIAREDHDASRPVSRKQLLTTERKQIYSLFKDFNLDTFCSTAFHLQVRAGPGSSCLLESGWVRPIQVRKDSATGEVLNLVFTWVDQSSELPLNVPLIFQGKDLSPGIKKGGNLKVMRKNLKFLFPAGYIPPKIVIDVSNLDLGEKIALEDIDVQPPLKLLTRGKDPLCEMLTTK